ncbi:NAD(P)-binding domain-containing protein, partial [bacterium]|nr:NAD(P)-binding domain-containing protein [bacterium]
MKRKQAAGGAIGIAGAGRIAQALGRLLFQQGQPIAVVASRSRSSAQRAARFVGPSVRAVDYSQLPAQAERLILAVADDALDEVAGT